MYFSAGFLQVAPPPPPRTHPEVVSDARPAYRIRPGGAQGQDQLSGYSPLPSRTSFKGIVSPDEYFLLSSNKSNRYILYMRGWFLRVVDGKMIKAKSKFLLASMKLLTSFGNPFSNPLQRPHSGDLTMILYTGSRMWP